jgi:hypothetical protein
MYVMLCVGLGLVLCGTAQADNLLLNSSFETNTGGGGSAANWTNTGATGTETWAWHTGDWGMAVYSWGGWEGCPWPEAGTGEFYQDVAVTGDTYYAYTIWATRDPWTVPMAGSITMKIEWYDGATLLSTVSRDITNAIGVEAPPLPNWVQVNIDPLSPTDADMARVMISTHVVNNALKFDDASFGVPEPVTMALLGLGSLFLVRRRK